MVTDGPIPFVPYMCGALAATALMARSTGCGESCSAIDRVPNIFRLAIYSLMVLAGTWIWVTEWVDRLLGFFLFYFASLVLMDRDERRAVGRQMTEPMTREHIVVSLALPTLVIGLPIVFFLMRGPAASRPPMQPSPEHAVADPFQTAINGAIVVLFTSRLPRLWWRYFFGTRGK